jgi:stage V sporulation protein B
MWNFSERPCIGFFGGDTMGQASGLLQRQHSMFYGAMLLTAGSLGLRLVQLLFQIYISGVMGAAGLGRMQLIMAVGSFGAILGSGGVRIAVTCLAAEEAGRDRASGVRAAVRCCAVYGLVLSVLVGAILYLFAEVLAETWVDDLSAALPLRIYALFLPVTVLWSVLAGYFTAAQRITELVGLEFFERLASIALVVLGIQTGFGGFDPCTMIFLGSSLATLCSFLLLLRRYLRSIHGTKPTAFRPMMVRLLKLAIPLGFNDMLRSGLGTIENILVPKGLRKSGESGESAIAAYGTICGMVFPVITFPSVILYSLSDLLVPEMARCKAKNRQERTIFLADKCLRLTLLFAAGVAGLCYGLGDQLGYLLFGSADAGTYIRVFSPLILILYLDAITDGMLKGLSQQIHSVRYNTLTSLMDVGMLAVLLPRYGIGGFLGAFTVSHAVNFFLSIRRLMVVTGYSPRFRATIKATLSCFAALYVLFLLPSGGAVTILGTVLEAGLFLICYLLLLLLTGALGRDDLRWLWGLVRQRPARK